MNEYLVRLIDWDTIFVDNMQKKAKAIEIVKGTYC